MSAHSRCKRSLPQHLESVTESDFTLPNLPAGKGTRVQVTVQSAKRTSSSAMLALFSPPCVLRTTNFMNLA